MKEYFTIPTVCPICEMDLEEDGKFLRCTNSNCTAATLGTLNRWIYGLKIMDIGIKTIETLHEVGLVNESADFYKLKISDIAGLDRLGERSAKKIINNLKVKMELTLPEFIGALNIDNFASAIAKTLVEAGFDTLEKMQNAESHELILIKGIEEKTASKIINGLKEKEIEIKNLLDVGITFKAIEEVKLNSEKLDGKRFCFTGTIERLDDNGKRYNRKMMEQLVLENGGTIQKVKKDLDYLVIADPNSTKSKAVKARKLNINLLSEKEFFEMVGM